MKHIIREILLQEAKKKKKADDRCTRIAKRKYDVWPSAYASGAVVKCRQGKIWKNESLDFNDSLLFENDEYEDLDWVQDIISQHFNLKKKVLYFDNGLTYYQWKKLKNFFKENGVTYFTGDPIDIISNNVIKSKHIIFNIDINNTVMWNDVDATINQTTTSDFYKILKDGKSDLSFNDVKEKTGYLFTEFGVNFLNGYNFINSQNIWESKKDFSKEKEEGLHGWFARQGGSGKGKGWVDCNTCRTDKKTGRKKCKTCGRQEGEKRAKYPRCRPTPSQCKGYKRPDER